MRKMVFFLKNFSASVTNFAQKVAALFLSITFVKLLRLPLEVIEWTRFPNLNECCHSPGLYR